MTRTYIDLHKKSFMIGLPETGKTTFLAALWHVVESGELPNSLILNKFNGDLEYLNRIRSLWISCNEIGRTQPLEEMTVSMELISENGSHVTELTIPDLSGETYKYQWMKRQWTKEYSQLVKEASGALLFIHPSHVIEPVRIDEAEPLVRTIEGESQSAISEQRETPWDPEKTPTQVKLVEILQYIQHFPDLNIPFKIAVVISAWDLVEEVQKGLLPVDYLRKRLPLLNQYLLSNSDVFPSRVYGISAQGGSLQSSDQLLKHTQQSERIIVKYGENSSHNITEPIAWLMH